jgi:hypothetical protein
LQESEHRAASRRQAITDCLTFSKTELLQQPHAVLEQWHVGIDLPRERAGERS